MKINIESTSPKQFGQLYHYFDENIDDCVEFIRKTMTSQIAQRLKYMPYKEYLNTVYWKVISLCMRTLVGKCQDCGFDDELNVHHLDYSYRGKEYKYPDCLEVLCRRCHGDISYKPPKDKKTEKIIEKLSNQLSFSSAEEKKERQFKRLIQRIHE